MSETPLDALSYKEQHELVKIVNGNRVARDPNGNTWSISDFLGMGFTRREAIKLVGLVAGGMALGGAITEVVSAQASTSDSDGNVGLPGDRVDVFADGVDANSVSTGELATAIENASDVSGSRSLDTWEQNTSGHVLIAAVEMNVTPSSGTSVVRVFGDVNNDSQSNQPQNTETVVGTGSTEGFGGPMIFVPDGANYQFRQFGDTGDSTLSSWYEAGWV